MSRDIEDRIETGWRDRKNFSNPRPHSSFLDLGFLCHPEIGVDEVADVGAEISKASREQEIDTSRPAKSFDVVHGFAVVCLQ